MAVTASHISHFLKTTKYFDKVLKNIVIKSVKNGDCVAEMKVEEEHINSMGGLHGGLSATLVDGVSGYALVTHENGAVPSVSIDIHMTYMKAAKLGDEIVITTKAEKVGRSLAFLKVLITNKNTGDILVKGTHTKFFMQDSALTLKQKV